MRWNLASLRWRLVAGMGLGVAAAVLVSLATAYWQLREYALRTGGDEQLRQQQVIAAGLDAMFASIERRTAEMGEQLRTARLTPAQAIANLRAGVLHHPETAQKGVFTEADNPTRNGRFAAAATYTSHGLQVIDFVATGYEYWNKDWYHKALASPNGRWAEPYFNDAAGGQDTVSFNLPLRDIDDRVYGMASMSITLDHIAEVAAELGLVQLPAGSRHVLADASGRLLLVWDPAFERAYDLERAARRAESASLDWLARIGPEAPAQVVRVVDRHYGPERLAFTPLPRTGWRLGTVLPERELLAPLHTSLARGAGFAALVLFIALVLFAAQARRIAKPLERLARDAERLGDGELVPVAILPGHTGSEVGRLQSAFSHVRNRLQQQNDRLLESERGERLATGRWQRVSRTQRELLPADRVFFGPRLQCEAAAEVRSAEGVANCSYGFTVPAPGQCVFYLAELDSSDLEVALLLARLDGMVAALARQGGGPTELLRRVSEHWQSDGETGRSPQLLVGRLDLDTGHLSLASANHVAPVILDCDGRALPVQLEPGPSLDSHSRPDWPAWHGSLGDQERLLLYSRSVVELHDRHGHRFGHHALPATVAAHHALPAPELAGALLDHAIAFTREGNAPGRGIAAMVLSVRERD